MAERELNTEIATEGKSKPKNWAIGALLGFAVYLIISSIIGLSMALRGSLDGLPKGNTISQILLYLVAGIPFLLSGALFMEGQKRLALISFIIFWVAITCAFLAWYLRLLIIIEIARLVAQIIIAKPFI